jgi:hypothetical protein
LYLSDFSSLAIVQLSIKSDEYRPWGRHSKQKHYTMAYAKVTWASGFSPH